MRTTGTAAKSQVAKVLLAVADAQKKLFEPNHL